MSTQKQENDEDPLLRGLSLLPNEEEMEETPIDDVEVIQEKNGNSPLEKLFMYKGSIATHKVYQKISNHAIALILSDVKKKQSLERNNRERKTGIQLF